MTHNRLSFLLLLLLFIVIPFKVYSYDNGLGLTPPMGWSSWNYFRCTINESIIMNIASTMVTSGLINYGYEYINIDDCWAYSRNATGFIQPDPYTFPSGMPYLVDYIHSLGLKFGIYTDAYNTTWQHRPGSEGYEKQDALTYASWGVDYLKEDWMKKWDADPTSRYKLMSDALNATGRPIFFNICDWGYENPWQWASSMANSWRTAFDIQDNWPRIMSILDLQTNLSNYSGPSLGWNDMDSLEVGNGNMTMIEYQSHFSIWCMMASPLILGNDLTNMTVETLSIITAIELIQVNQDPLGIQARLIQSSPNNITQVWSRPLYDGSVAVLLLNRGNVSVIDITVQWVDIGFHPNDTLLVRDLWARQDKGDFTSQYTAYNVPIHGCLVLKVLLPT